MKFAAWFWLSLVAIFVCSEPALARAAARSDHGGQPILHSLPIHASATNTSPEFNKYVYSFELASPVNFRGLSGSVGTFSGPATFSEALISIHSSPTDHCPASGSVFRTYPELNTRYPSSPLGQFMVKGSGSGKFSVPTSYELPAAIPIRGCLFVVLDGSNLSGGKFSMTSNMSVLYDTAQPASPAPFYIGMDDEFCFGQNTGCELASVERTRSHAFAKVVHVDAPLSLLAMSGNVSDGALNTPPSGHWTMRNDYFIYRGGCRQFPAQNGMYGPADYFASVPATAEDLLKVAKSGNGYTALESPVFKVFSGVALVSGDCLVHLVEVNAKSGSIDAESQVLVLVAPANHHAS